MNAEAAELEIIRSELKAIGIDVPLEGIARWATATRARVEQWAIRERWHYMKGKPPCPKGHKWPRLKRPKQVDRWVSKSRTTTN